MHDEQPDSDYFNEQLDAATANARELRAGLERVNSLPESPWVELPELEAADTPEAIVEWIDTKLGQMYGGQFPADGGYVKLERVRPHWSPSDPFATVQGTYYLVHRPDHDEPGEPPLAPEERGQLTGLSDSLSPFGPARTPDVLVRIYLAKRLGRAATAVRLAYPRHVEETAGKLARELHEAISHVAGAIATAGEEAHPPGFVQPATTTSLHNRQLPPSVKVPGPRALETYRRYWALLAGSGYHGLSPRDKASRLQQDLRLHDRPSRDTIWRVIKLGDAGYLERPH